MKVKIKLVLSSPEYKVIHISGEAGDSLERHKVNNTAVLLVQEGSIEYQEEGSESISLSAGEGHPIPAEQYHHVKCIEQAAFFVLLPQQAKMKFA